MADPSVKTHKALADVSRFRILEDLRGRGPLDSRELGRLIGLHPNTVRWHVDQLIEAGLVRAVRAPAAGRGRPRVLYEAIVASASGQQVGYRLLAQILAGYLAGTDHPQVVAESAGQAWGSYLTEKPQPFTELSVDEATQKVVELFDELGFMPEAVEESDERKILLHRCPFREVAESNQRVVCAVHLGLLKGALSEMGAPLQATRLEPFVEPTLCVAHLRRNAIPRPPGGVRRARSRPRAVA
ncbi:MAG TPA: helix-turn-helix domain-containing protein [Candidatus Micrarchaeaceae archaeon]|nr:helix-turn-helix domain-containing protein [Candidatus Micrarchaeaceae archaeon]